VVKHVGKSKSKYVCQNCGYDSLRWLGRCPDCGEWNTIVEEIISTAKSKNLGRQSDLGSAMPSPITSVDPSRQIRISSGCTEFDRVLGGGIVPGSLVLIGGDPGIGKSTLLLQIVYLLSCQDLKVFYVSGEESILQLRMRAERLGALDERLLCLTETDLDLIESFIDSIRPDFVVIDSIQTVHRPDIEAAPGSVSQVRECTARLLKVAKSLSIPVFIIGHVTKAGTLAGPKMLEHMVDTVLYFEGERHHSFRILRTVKNRFGSTNEIGVFQMNDRGLTEISNPSELFLNETALRRPGSTVVCTLEGTRPLLVEVQALVGRTAYGGSPRRLATGADYNRVSIILAVLERYLGFQLSTYDVYLNVVGGVKLDEPAADLAIAVAVASSFKNIAISSDVILFGEVGLAGEVRGVRNPEARVKEAAKLGFSKCIVAEANAKTLCGPNMTEAIEIHGVKSINSAISACLRKGES
jgi:DNA repair protein RadA/Sms